MGAGNGLIGIAAQGAAERAIAVIVDNEIGVTPRTAQPTIDGLAIPLERIAHGGFGGGAIDPGRGGADIALAAETLAEFVVGTADVLAEGVAAGRFVLGEIARGTSRARRSWDSGKIARYCGGIARLR